MHIQEGRNFFLPGRSVALACSGMVATSHPLATATGIEILRRGGNAIDASIAACAVLSVAEPGQTGIGGDCFAMLARHGSLPVIAYNGSGRAPRRADLSWFQERGMTRIEPFSPHAVTIPGAVEAWYRLANDYGRFPFAELLAPAINYARNGVPLHARVAYDIARHVEKLRMDPRMAESFLVGGKAPATGTVMSNPALARVLEQIAAQGPDAFYKGTIATTLTNFLQDRGGLHDTSDFADHTGSYVTPMAAPFAGFHVYECPPNGQGVVALMILRMLERLGPNRHGALSGERLHAVVEAARIAFALRDECLGDPEHSHLSFDHLLADSWTATQASRIRADARLSNISEEPRIVGSDTVYLSVVDRERTAVSLINSLFDTFGSGLMEPETGIVLHNRGASFRLLSRHPNAVAPKKRPMHTIMPGMLVKGDRVVMPFGVMGGHFQPVGHALLLSNLFQYDLDLQEAVDIPRLFPQEGRVWLESGIPLAAREHLRSLGHDLAERRDPLGGAQLIWVDHERGVLCGASDPRKDGCALGY